MGYNTGLDYARWTKRGLGLGVAMFVLGAAIAGLGTQLFGSLPEWELTLAVDMMVLGIATGFVAVFGFGVVLPLIE
ncbi:hypothetical protein ACFO5R_18145 [Halosolutus amylolyticus]|uniref:Major facilitator superfamily (MFS) profile domain-containing protein n=1 Tax=Halosolutus amylolyticus TaxID=2932267 RepID=A0ABD5PTM7_9EURY|nr:hypothetical protein [Halosolutus amylolyticus]